MDVSWLKRKRTIVAAAVAVIVVSLGVRSAMKERASESGGASGESAFYEVERGPLTISVNVSGTIKASEQEIIKCEVEGQTTILSIVPEGQHVKKGELLVELDASQLQDARVDQEIRVQNAEAAFVSAREQLEVTKNQAESDIDKAKLTLQFAEEDLKNFQDGDFPKQLKEAESKITLSEGTAKRAEERLAGSERLAEKGFITSIEREADKQDALKARLDLELAEHTKKLLTDFTYKRQITQLESDVHQAKMALERIQRKAAADVVEAEASLKAKESEYTRQKSKLDKNEEQIEKTKIYAPADGLVVYATSGRGGFRGNEEPLDEGQVVRERQELIHLPTGSSFKAEVDVHEASLTKIKQGLPVVLTVDALPGKTFHGHVVSVAPLPDAQSMWLNPDLKVYNTDIIIEGDGQGLRTGMTCLAEIVVEEHDDAVYVPVQAIVRVAGLPTAYVGRGNSSEPRTVELGLDNNRMVHVLSGLEPGERVLLTPPLTEEKTQNGGRPARQNAGAAASPDGAAGSSEPKPAAGESAPPAGEPSQSGPAETKDEAGGRPPDEQGGNREGVQPGTGDAEAMPSREEMRKRFENASPEEREKMRQEMEERMKNLSPEDRERLMQRRGRREGQESNASEEGGS